MIHIQKMTLDLCNQLLLEILSRPECKESHLEFLMRQMWSDKDISVSNISMKQLLMDRDITSTPLFQHFLELGLHVGKDDIYLAIENLRANQVHLFKFIAAKANFADLDELCQAAVSSNRMMFVVDFVELGAKLPGNGEELLKQALDNKDYGAAIALAKWFPKDTVEKLNLSSLMHFNILNCPELIKVLLQSGMNPNGRGGKHPIEVIMVKYDSSPKKIIDLVSILLESGADCNHLCDASKSSATSTPLHKATELSLKAGGDVKLIKSVINSHTFNQYKTVNDKGETPLHLAVKTHWKKEDSRTVLSALLEMDILDPTKKDHSGRRPIDYCQSKSERHHTYTMLKGAMNKGERDLSQQKKQKKKKGKDMTSRVTRNQKQTINDSVKEVDEAPVSTKHEKKKEGPKEVQPQYKDFTIAKKLEFHIKRLIEKGAEYFEVDMTGMAMKEVISLSENKSLKKSENGRKNTEAKKGVKGNVSSAAEPMQHVTQTEEKRGMFSKFGLDFDQLPWEVEVTANVVKFLKDAKKVSFMDQWKAAHVIYTLAKGITSEHRSKRVGSEKSLQLYEARMGKAARILWEKAISYSAKLTGPSANPVYSQVIRVWEIILDHDDLSKRIKYCTEQIEKSHMRGLKASARLSLQIHEANETNKREKVRGRKLVDIPMRFLLQNAGQVDVDHHFIPPASRNDNEYNVTTFHTFDTISAKSMLFGTNDRRDFPFKEWPKEHEIIKLNSKEAILLLGRSGTGKTTCCLYRLWNEFKSFWSTKLMSSPLDVGDNESYFNSSQLMEETSEYAEDAAPTQVLTGDEKAGGGKDTNNDQGDSGAKSTRNATPYGEVSDQSEFEESMESIEENLHQVFITKNYVLCGQMNKHFYDMAAAYEFLGEHMKNENTNFIDDLSKVDDYAFPLFLTARQFYKLLDKSLGGSTFFDRDERGNIVVTVLSLDYQQEDPDILLDLEESDSEDEEIEGVAISPAQSPCKEQTKQWIEVTALYFKEIIWPRISKQCNINSKDFDPLLVWTEIQSFIKGSEYSLRHGPLNLQGYMEIGNHMAPNYASHRDTIYKLFLKYQQYIKDRRHHKFMFDECDLVSHLYSRLKNLEHLPWSTHSFYIDEVQDFTQAELTTLIHCCCNPNNMFFTGDTAQSIMRGIAFRFQDLRSIFYRINHINPEVKVPHTPYNLTTNFRSHSGILKLARSIIDLIREFFRDSIDHLPDDEGMFPGPIPVLFESCKVEDLSLLLSTNKRKASAIEFGAHQVIIVQSQQAKDSLPSILKGAIVLTIFEAKGLEFDDVLLYNFFNDSIVDEKSWRVISSYLEMSKHCEKIINPTKLPGSPEDPRSLQFDDMLHKSLNSELKHLYTAVTRAKCNLWVYDANIKKRLSMFDYWHKRHIVKVVQAQPLQESQGAYSLVFASNSTPEQWKAQGDNFRKKHLWEQAVLCYKHAGSEHEYLAKEIHAYCQIQNARHQNPQFYLEAAVAFLECDDLHHNLRYLRHAAICLRDSKPPKYREAAKLFECLGEFDNAAQLYKKGGDIDSYVRMERKRKQQRNDVKVRRKIKLYKEAGDYDQAFKALIEKKMFKDAYKLAFAQGVAKCVSSGSNETWLQVGLKAAQEHQHDLAEASFVFQITKVQLKELQAGSKSVNENVLSSLEALLKCKDHLIKAQAYILLGMLKKDVELCQTAWRHYHSVSHRVGELEAFNQVLLLTGAADHQLLISMCHVASETKDAFIKAADINKIVKEGLCFYGLLKIGFHYYISKLEGENIWIGEPLLNCACEGNKYDLDGMIRLETSSVRHVLAEHFKKLKSMWLSQSHLQQELEPKLISFSVHSTLLEHQKLLRWYSRIEVSDEQLYDYLQTICKSLELHSLQEENTNNLTAILVSIFTPSVYTYLSQRIKEAHIAVVRNSFSSHSHFPIFVKSILPCDVSFNAVKIDSWLMAWRVSCISEPTSNVLFDRLRKLEKHVNSHQSNAAAVQECEYPHGFVYWEHDKCFYHIFSIWWKSCVELREKGNFLLPSKLAVNHFVGNICKHMNDFSFELIDVVDILSIHCTGILAILTHIRALQKFPVPCTVPVYYSSNVQVFSLMNSWKAEHQHLLSACADEVNNSKDIGKLFREGCQLLTKALDFIVGCQYGPNCGFLSMGFDNMPSSDGTKQCLILAFVVIGNLSMLSIVDALKYFQMLQSLINKFLQTVSMDELPSYGDIVNEAIRNPNFLYPPVIFSVISKLLQDANIDSSFTQLVFKDNLKLSGSEVKFIGVESVQREQAALESENDLSEDIEDMSLALSTKMAGHLSQLNPDDVDPEILSSSFCSACNIPLLQNDEFENKEQALEVSLAKEIYLTHVCSDLHHSNVLLYKMFLAEVSPPNKAQSAVQAGGGLYHILRLHLEELLADYCELRKQFDSDELGQHIDDIEEEMEKNDHLLSELEKKCNWKKAIEEMSRMKESLDRLVKRWQDNYSRLSTCSKQTIKQTEEENTQGSKDKEIDLLEEFSEIFDDANNDTTGGRRSRVTSHLRSEDDKLKSRQRKKEKQCHQGKGSDKQN